MSEKREVSINALQKLPGKGKISDYKDRTDPKYVGPGTWDFLTRLAVKATTSKLELEFKRELTEACEGYPCHVCAGHCKEYMKNHPVDKYFGMFITIEGKKIMIGMFIWIWKFHNAVNARLNKPIMDWDTAYNTFYPGEVLLCSAACMAAEEKINPVKSNKKGVPKKKKH